MEEEAAGRQSTMNRWPDPLFVVAGALLFVVLVLALTGCVGMEM